jgi:hypothetical protein
MGMSFIGRRLGLIDGSLFSSNLENSDPQSPKNLQCENSDGVRVEVAECSQDMAKLCGRASPIKGFSLQINLGRKVDFATSVSVLETISNSLFFQIEMELGIALSLRKTFRRRVSARSRFRSRKETWDLEFPKHEYDKAPISLYWYAKSARGMPLLEFLAYYQVVECYFPKFAKLEVVRSVRKILKNPTFRIDRESDLTTLVSTISGNGRISGSEKEQMRATVLEVVSVAEVADFFEANKDIAEVVVKKQKGITDKAINLARKDHDHRNDIADILYEIRCRIVHTKE